MEGTTASAQSDPSAPDHVCPTSTLAFNRHFTSTPQGALLVAEIVCGLVVWTLVGGTDYFRVAALCWLMFMSVVCWVLTTILFLIRLTGASSRITHIPWKTLYVCFNSSATVLYLVTAAVNTASVSLAIRGRHNYNCWAASSFFAFLVTLCYAGSSYLSYRAWRTTKEEE